MTSKPKIDTSVLNNYSPKPLPEED